MRIFLLFVLVNFVGPLPAFSETIDKSLQVGDSLILKGHGPLRAQKSAALKLIPTLGGVEVLGLKTGTSEIRIGKKIWNIQILTAAQIRTRQILEKWSQARLGLQVKVENAEVILTGRIFRSEDWLGLLKLCSHCNYSSELEMEADTEEKISLEIDKILKRRGLPTPSLRWNPEALWYVNKDNSSGLRALAKSLGIELKSQAEVVDVAPLIRTQIFVMEVRREKTRQWGLEWPDSVSAQVLPQFKNPLEQLMVSAHALEKSGQARILASPALLCRSGQEAEFLAGGEFPIKVFNRLQSGVVWRKYGILVKVRPKADRFGKMSLSLETEVSNIDGSRVVDGIPGLLTNRVLSHFDLSKSRTIAISGLIRNDESESTKGLPGLSQIPILGALFSSKEFRENKTELIILVKPETLNLSAENK